MFYVEFLKAEQKRNFDAEIESLRLSISELQSHMKTKVDEISNLTTQVSTTIYYSTFVIRSNVKFYVTIGRGLPM